MDVRMIDPTDIRIAFGLTAQEGAVAHALYRAKGRVLSRGYLDDEAPHIRTSDRDERCVETFIHRIRKKMGPDSIETIRSAGWRMTKVGLARCERAMEEAA